MYYIQVQHTLGTVLVMFLALKSKIFSGIVLLKHSGLKILRDNKNFNLFERAFRIFDITSDFQFTFAPLINESFEQAVR